MVEEKSRSEEDSAQGRGSDAARESTALAVVDLGRASKRTRGQITGFITEPSAFPLRDF